MINEDEITNHTSLFEENGEYQIVEGWFRNKILHNENGPAFIIYDKETNNVLYKTYYINGEIHRIDGPAISIFDNLGNIKQLSYIVNNHCHRDDGPAMIIYENDSKKEYFWFDKIEFKDLKELQNYIKMQLLK